MAEKSQKRSRKGCKGSCFAPRRLEPTSIKRRRGRGVFLTHGT